MGRTCRRAPSSSSSSGPSTRRPIRAAADEGAGRPARSPFFARGAGARLGDMRIGIVAPVWIAVPPEGYGGIELVVSLLTEELVARGHDVTLFASGDSRTKATLRAAYETAPTERIWEVEPDAAHVGSAYRFAYATYESGEGYDLRHDHTDPLGVAFGACIPSPVVHTVHMPLDDRRREFLARFDDDVYLTAISDYQRKEASELNWHGMVHNAVDIESFAFRETKGDYVLSIGRI